MALLRDRALMASGVSRSSPTAEPAIAPIGRRSELPMDRLQAKATSRSAYLDMCSRAVAWLSASAAVVSARTAADDCRVGGGKEFGAHRPGARADGKPIDADESLSRRAVLKRQVFMADLFASTD